MNFIRLILAVLLVAMICFMVEPLVVWLDDVCVAITRALVFNRDTH